MATMTPEPVVWIIDAEQWPRSYIRAELIERGIEAVGHIDLSQAVAALRRRTTARPRVIVLEARDQAIDRALVEAIMKTRIPVVLLVGALEANEPILKDHKW